jgi:phosphatidylethanolamine-binding protein
MAMQASVVEFLKHNQIINDVISDENFNPSVLFSVKYPLPLGEAKLGNRVDREQTLEEPEIVLPEVQPQHAHVTDETAYTLVMTDPDVPSRQEPTGAQFRHWIVSDCDWNTHCL